MYDTIGKHVSRTKENVEAARALLDRFHAYVETRGFDINTAFHGNLCETDLPAVAKGDFTSIPEEDGAVCFIGGARLMAGVYPWGWSFLSTGDGDGPELPIALALLDEAAVRMGTDKMIEELREELEEEYGNEYGPGKLAEIFGFRTREGEEGIPVIRTALRIAAEELGEI